MQPNGTLYCQPYTPPNLTAIIPSVILGATVLTLILVTLGLYWRHLHRLNVAAHAKMKGPPGELGEQSTDCLRSSVQPAASDCGLYWRHVLRLAEPGKVCTPIQTKGVGLHWSSGGPAPV